MTLVPGDPGSLSACAATASSSAHRLAALAATLGPSVEGLADGWPGRTSAALRRRGAALTGATASIAARLEVMAVVLQDQATDLADLLARARAVEERAGAAGLEVRDGRVVPTLGVLAVADDTTATVRAGVADRLQSELDLVLSQHRHRRDAVLRTLHESYEALAEVSRGLRRG